MIELTTILVIALPYIGAALSLALNKLGKIRNYIAVLALLMAAVAGTLVLMGFLSGGVMHFSYTWIQGLNVNLSFYIDGLSSLMAFIVGWLSFLIGLYSLKYMGEEGSARYWFFFDFFVGSMLLLVLAGDLIVLLIGWEGVGLASYSLIGYWFWDPDERCVGDPGRKALGESMHFTPSHSGNRALIFTMIGDIGLVIGIAMIYLYTGTFSIPEIAEKAGEWAPALFNGGLLTVFLLSFSLGPLSKSAQFPFHEWIVTAMTGPTSVSALIHAATLVKAGIYLLLRFVPIFFNGISSLTAPGFNLYFIILAAIGGFTAFLMATQACVAREGKLVLAFSTSSQLGYMVMGLAAAGILATSGNLEGLVNGFAATLYHLMSHAIFKASLFLAMGAVIHEAGSRFMDETGGLSKHMKFTFIAMILAALSLSGIPPFMGFWTKDSLLEIVSESGLQIPLLLGLVTAGLTAFYSMRLVFLTFKRKESQNVMERVSKHKLHEAPYTMLAPYFLLAVITLGVGLAWPIVSGPISHSMSSYILGFGKTEIGLGTLIGQVHVSPLLILGVGMAVSGLIMAYLVYISPGYINALVSAMGRNKLLSGLHTFLYNRWFLNSIYYRVFVRGGGWVSDKLFTSFETPVIDGVYHRYIPNGVGKLSSNLLTSFETPVIDNVYNKHIPNGVTSIYQKLFNKFETSIVDEGYNRKLVNGALGLSRIFRRIQTGKVNYYLTAFALGVILLIAIVIGLFLL